MTDIRKRVSRMRITWPRVGVVLVPILIGGVAILTAPPAQAIDPADSDFCNQPWPTQEVLFSSGTVTAFDASPPVPTVTIRLDEYSRPNGRPPGQDTRSASYCAGGQTIQYAIQPGTGTEVLTSRPHTPDESPCQTGGNLKPGDIKPGQRYGLVQWVINAGVAPAQAAGSMPMLINAFEHDMKDCYAEGRPCPRVAVGRGKHRRVASSVRVILTNCSTSKKILTELLTKGKVKGWDINRTDKRDVFTIKDFHSDANIEYKLTGKLP